MPESVEDFKSRLDMQTISEDLVDTIANASYSNQDKMVELLSIVAKELIQQNFNLETIKKELEDHTLSLDSISDAVSNT